MMQFCGDIIIGEKYGPYVSERIILMAEDAKQLIHQAFQRAKQAGKADWNVMTTAVLKSRMLNITSHEFDEEDYGYPNFTQFLHAHDDIVSLDTSKFPALVRLRQAGSAKLKTVDTGTANSRERIRRDLWLAILDYSSGDQYVWDESSGEARRGELQEDARSLPTITKQTMQEWRRELADSIRKSEDLSFEQSGRLYSWSQMEFSTHKLPNEIKYRWYDHLKNKVLERLRRWFEESALEQPKDLVSSAPLSPKTRTDIESLRGFVVRVIEKMTERELEQINLPARAVLKTTGPVRNEPS